MTKQRRDEGYTLIELLLVIVVLGILATIVAVSVGGAKTNAKKSACSADKHVLYTATEAFFAQRGTTTIPPAATSDPEAHERWLVQEHFLHSPSTYFNVTATGGLVPVVPQCTL